MHDYDIINLIWTSFLYEFSFLVLFKRLLFKNAKINYILIQTLC